MSLIKILPGKQEQCLEMIKKLKEKPINGVKIHKIMFCLGKYDLVIFGEADEIKTLELSANLTPYASMETLTTIPFEDGINMLRNIYWFKREDQMV